MASVASLPPPASTFIVEVTPTSIQKCMVKPLLAKTHSPSPYLMVDEAISLAQHLRVIPTI
jgi:hypothetical protein